MAFIRKSEAPRRVGQILQEARSQLAGKLEEQIWASLDMRFGLRQTFPGLVNAHSLETRKPKLFNIFGTHLEAFDFPKNGSFGPEKSLLLSLSAQKNPKT